VGALVGTVGGLTATAVICVAAHSCSEGALLVGTVAGAAIGATAGAATWKPIVLGQHTAMGLSVAPRRAGAAVGVQVAF
jgi:uncharacterized membrane protein